MPTLTITGLPSSLKLNDGYVQTGQTNNGQPVWIGTRNGAVAYLCVGEWVFRTIVGGQDYQSDMSECIGSFVLTPSKRQLYTGGSWIDVDVTAVTVTCSSSKRLRTTATHNNAH